MSYDHSIVAVIEAAHARSPYCRACGSHTTVRSEGERVLIECGAAEEPRGRFGRFLYQLGAHERVQVLP